jgi:hypothetical protein
MVARLGTISTAPPDPESLPDIDPTQLLHWRHLAIGRSRVLPYEIIHPRHAARQGLKLLRDGGYLVIIADAAEHAPPESLLGHAWAIPSGPIWFAQRSGKPIVPFTVMPYGLGWRLWLGAPIEPTRAGMRNGLEACLRRSPFGWERRIAMQWFEAKGQGASGRGDGPSHTPRPGITGETPDQDVGAARSPVLRGP